MRKSYMVINEVKAPDVLSWFLSGRLKRIKRFNKNVNEIEVAGGDGTDLGAIRKHWKKGLPFFGIDRGTLGFLLNPIETFEDYLWAIENYYTIELNLLKVRFVKFNGTVVDTVAFNDVYVKNMKSEQGMRGIINCIDDFEDSFDGDGIIVATPQGSTAYTRTAGGNILSLNDELLAVTSICGTANKISTVTDAQEVEMTFALPGILGVADNKVVKNIEKIEISILDNAVSLAFKNGYDFRKMRYRFMKDSNRREG